METVIKMTADGFALRTEDPYKWEQFIHMVATNNTFCPSIKRVIFNLKTAETRPVLDADGKPVTDEKGRVQRTTVDVTPSLATAVYFADGTKCTVVNSDKDVVTTEEKEVTYVDCDKSGKESTIKTGRKVKVATEAAKEAGVVYAIVKRIFGKIDTDSKSRTYGQIKGDGFGRKLHDLVDGAFDTQYEAAFNDEMKKLSAKEHKEREAAAKERRAKRTPTIEENIATLVKQNTELIEKLSK